MRHIVLKTKPVPLNKRLMVSRGSNRMILSTDYRNAKEAVGFEVLSQWKEDVLEDPVTVNVLLYLKDKRLDIDAYIKLLLDAMSNIVYKDDKQVEELHVFKMYDKQDPRIEISILT